MTVRRPKGFWKRGDEIVAVEGQQVAEAGYQQAVSLVRGTAGTDVRLTVRRGDEIFDVTVTRADIVDTGIHGEIYGNIGYVKVSAFNNATPEAFYNTVYDQIDAGVEGLVFDLRGNGGGLLTSVTGMLDFLLPEGDLVSRTDKEGENDRHVHLRRQLHRPADGGAGQRVYRVGGGAVCLRFTGSTASLSLSAPRPTAKGVMQTTYELSDGSSLTLTTDYYNPMSGQNYNGEGVTPDIVVEMTEEEQENYRLLDPERDPQLKAALEALGVAGLNPAERLIDIRRPAFHGRSYAFGTGDTAASDCGSRAREGPGGFQRQSLWVHQSETLSLPQGQRNKHSMPQNSFP